MVIRITALIVPLALLCLGATGRKISVKLKAPWPTTTLSPVQEVSEFVSEESSSDFWLFIAALRKDPETTALLDKLEAEPYSETAHEQIAALVIEVAASLLSPLQLAALRLTLAVRSFAPLVETHQSLASVSAGECQGFSSSWVVLRPSGKVLCHPSDLETMKFIPSPQHAIAEVPRTKVDHVHQIAGTAPQPVQEAEDATLYGRLGTSSFFAMHDALATAQSVGRVKSYVFRHGVAPPGSSVHTTLQGYGVNLDIKNMEYQNLDDGSATNSGDADGSTSTDEVVSFEEGEELGGFVFSTLHARRPELGTPLSMLRKELLDEDEGEELKVWKMKDLGLQAAATIMDKGKFKDPLRGLADLAQDFPVHAKYLSTVKVSKGLRSEVEANTMSPALRQGMLGGGGRASLFVNGRSLDVGLNTFNLFKLLQMVRSETRQLAKLAALRLPASTARALLALGSAGGAVEGESEGPGGGDGSQVRINIVKQSKGIITFVNNLEKDAQYKRWPRSLRQLAFPSWSLHSLSRNLYTLIVVLDPTTPAGVEALEAIQGLHQQMYPVRFGIVLTSASLVADHHRSRGLFSSPSKDTPAQPADEAASLKRRATAADVGVLFSEAKLNHSSTVASAFLFSVASELGYSFEVLELVPLFADAVVATTSEFSKAVLEDQAKAILGSLNHASLGKGISSGSEASLFALLNMTRFAADKGLPVNTYTLNGLLSEDLDLSQGLLQLLGREQHLLGQMVKDGRLLEPSKAKKNSKAKGKGGGKSEEDESPPAGKVKSVLSVLMSEPGVVGRFHSLVSEKPKDMRFLLPAPELTTALKYLHPEGTRHYRLKRASIVLVDDWGSAFALGRLYQSLEYLTSSPQDGTVDSDDGEASVSADDVVSSTRLALVLSPTAPLSPQALAIQAVFDALIGAADNANILGFLLAFVGKVRDGVPLTAGLVAKVGAEAGLDDALTRAASGAVMAATKNRANATPGLVTTLMGKELKGAGIDGGTVVIANGRCLTLDAEEPFLSSDLRLLAEVEVQRRALSVETLVDVASFDGKSPGANSSVENDWRSDAVAIGSAFLGQYTQESREDVDMALSHMHSEHTLLTFNQAASSGDAGLSDGEEGGGGEDGHGGELGSVSVTVVLNPLSEAAQRVAPLLLVLRDELKVPLRVLLLPDTTVTKFPLSKFYRYVVGADVGEVSPGANFADLPSKHVLTMRMDVPEPWNVQSSYARQDVDNLKCDDKGCGDGGVGEEDETRIEYTLKSLLAAGQCFDLQERKPPNGLQLKLQRLGGQESSDTVVMQNLGYFQLQAAPGVWDLSLAEGRGKELFEIEGGTDFSSDEGSTGLTGAMDGGGKVESVSVAVTTFYDTNVPLKVRKQKGKELLELLEKQPSDTAEVDAGGGILSSAYTSMFGGGKAQVKLSQNGDDDTIHVFSLATGHLYERFLKIMMLSSVKRCSMKIKFWLLENFLSPTFKASAHAMASEFGFEVGFVSYTWPSWLRQQTSKQRIIWGYKILFLDVLFPLNVSKVIYVDSDQTVRGDLAELWTLDLKGHPYAYTPFCDSRKETLGYQFWRSGYWKDHLRGRPYHISALYVVDLDRFRRMAVGDQLRALYDNLSRDPNSLANLDQDLPNYAQHMIPIFSLPQEWLWCESWCSDGTKAKAKTIDLCNNPDHKEPKLDMAKRVVSGDLFPESWIELDEEIRNLEKRENIGSIAEAAEASLDMGFG
jgi:UDP-glucose:glycoprotein glucosyltransferase